MLVSPECLIKLIDGMESGVSTGLRVSAHTAPVIVEARRPHAPHRTGKFRVEKWDWNQRTSRLLVGRAAFDAARE